MYIYFFIVHRGSVIWIIVSANNSKIRFYDNNMYTLRVPVCRCQTVAPYGKVIRFLHFYTETRINTHILGTMNLKLFQTNLDDEHGRSEYYYFRYRY